MSRLSALSTLLAAGLLGAWCLPADAGEDLTPRPQRIFAEKPRIEDYADYNAFLVDIMEYRRQKEERLKATPLAPVVIPAPQQTASADPALYQIEGPESLEEALARASKLPHPVYVEPERYGRSTANSFPIPQMDGEDMASNEVPGHLSDLEAVNPLTYHDEVAQDEAEDDQKRNPTGDAKDRANRAQQGTNEAYRISYDTGARTITDSDGKTIWVPIVIKNEVDYTVVHYLDLQVEVIKN